MPPLTPEQINALLQYLIMQGGMQQAPLDLSFGQVPMADPEDDPLTTAKSSANFLQDFNSMLADPFTAAQAGPGAFNYAAFDPIIEDKPVDRPGERMMQFYQQSREGTVERMIADEIAAGGTASSAYAKVVSMLNATPGADATEDDLALQEMLRASIPDLLDEMGAPTVGMDGQPAKDLPSIMKLARDLEQNIAKDPIGNYQDPETGQWFDRTETPSEAAQVFQNLGLPLPTEQYTPEMMMGSSWMQATGGNTNADDWRRNVGSQRLRQMPDPTDRNAPRPPDPAIMLQQMSNIPPSEWSTSPLDVTAGKGGVSIKGNQLQMRDQGPKQDRIQSEFRQAQRKFFTDQLRDMTKEQNRLYGKEYYTNVGRTRAARQQGRTPLTDALMARRMQMLAAGLGSGFMPNG